MSERLTADERKDLKELKALFPEIKLLSRYKQISELRKYSRNKFKYSFQNGVHQSRLPEEPLDIFAFRGDGLMDKEKKYAEQCYESYKEKYNISAPSDLKLLETLVYWETMELRLKEAMKTAFKQIEEVAEDGMDINVTDVISKDANTAFKNATDMVVKLKKDLGLLYEKTKEEEFTTLQKVTKKVLEWGKTNIAERTFICRHCAGQNVLWVNPSYFEKEVSKHPHFKGKVLFNKEMIKLYLKGKKLKEKLSDLPEQLKNEILGCIIDEENIAEMLETSPDYTNWLIAKGWVQMEEYEEIKNEAEK